MGGVRKEFLAKKIMGEFSYPATKKCADGFSKVIGTYHSRFLSSVQSNQVHRIPPGKATPTAEYLTELTPQAYGRRSRLKVSPRSHLTIRPEPCLSQSDEMDWSKTHKAIPTDKLTG